MHAPDLREVSMLRPKRAEVLADAYPPHSKTPVLRIHDDNGSIYITCTDLEAAEAAAEAINRAIGVKL